MTARGHLCRMFDNTHSVILCFSKYFVNIFHFNLFISMVIHANQLWFFTFLAIENNWNWFFFQHELLSYVNILKHICFSFLHWFIYMFHKQIRVKSIFAELVYIILKVPVEASVRVRDFLKTRRWPCPFSSLWLV